MALIFFFFLVIYKLIRFC